MGLERLYIVLSRIKVSIFDLASGSLYPGVSLPGYEQNQRYDRKVSSNQHN